MPIDQSTDPFAALAAMVVSFLLPWLQTRRLAGAGSDHPVHVFLVNAIASNGHRLFSRVPGIVNPSYCGAFPLYMHWLLSFFGARAIMPVARYLNPVVSLLIVTLFYLSLRYLNAVGLYGALPGWTALALALTPQFFHAFSARNFGLSSRPLGLLLVMIFLLAHYVTIKNQFAPAIMVESIIVFLIVSFNTFAIQFLILFSIVYAILSTDFVFFVPIVIGIAIFVLVHPKYAISYLNHTIMFVRSYQKELANIFILSRRPSIWFDFVSDIPKKFYSSGILEAISYAYGNSLLIVIFLNPFAWIAGFFISGSELSDFSRYSFSMSLSGFILLLLTSFRSTRFLGEPERYVEFVAPFACAAAAEQLLTNGQGTVFVGLILWSLIANVGQIGIALKLQGHISGTQQQLKELGAFISKAASGRAVVFSSNSEEVVKAFMSEPWKFVRYWSFETKMAGLGVREAFSVYPFFRMDSFCRIAAAYGVSYAIIDKSVGEDITTFEARHGLSSRLLHETERYSAYALSARS